jgi:hypothetical protein
MIVAMVKEQSKFDRCYLRKGVLQDIFVADFVIYVTSFFRKRKNQVAFIPAEHGIGGPNRYQFVGSVAYCWHSASRNRRISRG